LGSVLLHASLAEVYSTIGQPILVQCVARANPDTSGQKPSLLLLVRVAIAAALFVQSNKDDELAKMRLPPH